ncbi:MAG TPA: hypothetical protein VFI13_02430, partial [Gemmatimonadales bacterium]|nr:hypothetical protein [Gemmatimonadales bacterium]
SSDTLVIVIDGKSLALAVRSPDGDRFWLTLPEDLPPGPHAFALRRGPGEDLPIGTFSTGGWAPARTIPGELAALTPQILTLLPGMVSMTLDQRIEVLDARAGTIRMVDTLRASGYDLAGYRLGYSVAPNSFTIMTGYFFWRRASLAIGGAIIDSATPRNLAYTMVHELGDGAWFYTDFSHYSFLETATTARAFPGHHFSERVATSDDGRWIIPSYEYSDSGLLILDRTDWSSRYLPGWGTADATIGATGDAYVLGTIGGRSYQGAPLWLARIDPSTGTSLASRRLADSVPVPNDYTQMGKVIALRTIDAVLVMRPSDAGVDLTFFDTGSLDPIGHLTIPGVATVCSPQAGWEPMVIEDPTFHRLYFTRDYCLAGAIPLATLQLPG